MYAYEYDNAGNLIRVRARSATGPVAAEYTYTNDGMLATATHGSTTLTNTWDALGNRIALSVTGPNACSYNYLYDVRAGVPAVIEEAKSGGDTYYYFRDPGGVLIARCRAGVSGSWQYYHYDETGSTRLLTDGDGDVTDTYAYDAYGSVLSHIGPTTDNPYQFVGALGYYTPHQAPEFRLIQTGFRLYDPETGRYTQQDPIRAGLNWYAYCGGNPVGAVDPWGLFDFYGWLGGLIGGGRVGDGLDRLLDGSVADTVGGVGDGLTFGMTGRIRMWTQTQQYVDRHTGWYVGGYVSGVVMQSALLGPRGPVFGRGGGSAVRFGYPARAGILNRGMMRLGFGWHQSELTFGLHGGVPFTAGHWHSISVLGRTIPTVGRAFPVIRSYGYYQSVRTLLVVQEYDDAYGQFENVPDPCP